MRFALVLLLSWLVLTPFARADAPAKLPATATIFNGRIEYTLPPDWDEVKSRQTSEVTKIYMASDHDGYLAIQVLPSNASISPAGAEKIIAQLRINHKKAKQEVVEEPKVEKDERFAIKIHERYKTADGKTADETHLYRQVAGKAMELDVQSLSDDQAHIDGVHKAGEDMLLSAEWKKAAQKKQDNK